MLDERKINIYVQELLFEVELIEAAAENYNSSCSAYNEATKNSDHTQIKKTQLQLLLNLNNVIGAAARISNLLFPKGLPKKDASAADEFRVKRGKALRSTIGIKNSVLRNKKLRNYLEHFDEKIDKWARDKNIRSYVSKMFGNLDNIKGLAHQDVMRQLDLEKAKMLIQGEAFDLQEIVSAAFEIKDKVKTYTENH